MSNAVKAIKLNPAGHRIALYIRVSTEEQAQNPEGSIKNQEERLRTMIKLKNMEGRFGEITNVFIDRAKSGKDTNRPQLQKLLLGIRKREIDLVMVSELSRISRSIRDFAAIWELMQQNSCGFYSLRENFDTTTAAGEMGFFTVANIAQFERRQISERVSAKGSRINNCNNFIDIVSLS
jgi:site-specific DNA recombinase